MKIAINTKPVDGPWGGGNRFVRAITAAAHERGHQVTFELSADVDLALIVDPRARNPQLTFTPASLFRHLRRNPRTVVAHRINECDERKGTRTVNWRLRVANSIADHTVFIASWLQELAVWRRDTPFSIILNGADERLFRRGSARHWDGTEPLKLVTHHWGANDLKGWDVYGRLDALLADESWRDRIAFTFIGNAPSHLRMRHIKFLPALDGSALAKALAEHHAYITGSVNEPAGMHHVEGALLGLPLLYRRSGALPQYCHGYGEPFNGVDDVAAAIERMMQAYPRWKSSVAHYDNTAKKMTGRYLDLFESLHAERDRLIAARKARRRLLRSVLIQIPA